MLKFNSSIKQILTFMKKLVLSFVVLGLVGCNAGGVNQSKKMLGMKLYQDSDAEQTVNIRIEHKNNFNVRLYPNGCITSMQPKFQMLPEVESAGMFQEQIKYKQKLLGMPFPPKQINFSEFRLPAERFLALSAYKSYHNGLELRGCSVDAIYKFASHKNYELLDNEPERQCSLIINEIMPNGERVEIKPLKVLININEWAGCNAQLEGLK